MSKIIIFHQQGWGWVEKKTLWARALKNFLRAFSVNQCLHGNFFRYSRKFNIIVGVKAWTQYFPKKEMIIFLI